MKQRALRRSVGLVILLVWAGEVVRAQNTPFSSPALDSNCYFPQIGVPGEIDTINGTVKNQYLGSMIKNLGPKPDGSFGNIFIENLVPSLDNGNTLSQVETGPGFDLHHMKAYLQKLESGGNDGLAQGFTVGHFRDKMHLDIFDGRIYLSDDAGNYDSTRFITLKFNIFGDRKVDEGYGVVADWYSTHLTSDSVDDIVISFFTDWVDYKKDTVFFALYRGGAKLASTDTIYEDTSIVAYSALVPTLHRYATQGDFRGTGRDDLMLADDSLNFYYFRNDPPFTLEKFAKGILHDTLMAKWQNPHLEYGTQPGLPTSYFSMRALPRGLSDRSVDWMPVFQTDDDRNDAIMIFRGGSDFGSHRITLDSAAFVIRHPKNLDPFTFGSGYYWPVTLVDAGDMTGTGNRVLDVTARNQSGDYGWDNFYVTGKALDEKIDMYNQAKYGFGYGDTLTANADSLEDYMTNLSWPNAPNDPMAPGGLLLYIGTKNIPVHLNPKWADVKSIPQHDDAGITFAPNPVVNSWSVATIVWPEEEEAEYKVYDMLGRMVERGLLRMLGGAEQQRIYFSGLVPGTYLYTLTGSRHTASTRFVKLSASGAPAGPPSGSFMQSLRDARDGRMAPASLSRSISR